MTKLLSACALLVFLTHTSEAIAGPRNYGDPSPKHWFRNRVTYYADVEGFPGLSRKAAWDLIKENFDKWVSVPTASLLVDGKALRQNVHTYSDFIKVLADVPYGIVIILDDTGEVAQEYSRKFNFELGDGLALTVQTGKMREANFYERVLILVNVPRVVAARAPLATILLHECGHALGLDHSQVNLSLVGDGDPAHRIFVPAMFPTAINGELTEDDKSWISELYPNGRSFQRSYGWLEGQVLLSGRPLGGVHVKAIRLNSQDSIEEASDPKFGLVTGALMRSETDVARAGYFKIPVISGMYRVCVERVSDVYTGGSAIGPFALKGMWPLIQSKLIGIYQVGEQQITNLGIVEVVLVARTNTEDLCHP